MAGETTFDVVDELVKNAKKGSILRPRIIVKKNGPVGTSQSQFEVTFNRQSSDDPFTWVKTEDNDMSTGFGDSHVIATHEAADHVCRALRAC